MIETVPSGTVLNERYRIERVLGSGGFGHVYLALDQSLNQPFAVKEYLVSGPSGQEQLMHEANVLSQLHHPNLPAFHDAFHENGRYYVVLNYIEGNDLTDIIRNATQKRNDVVPISQVMAWILATCDAVYFLHRQQPPVIHRDIKPDNIRIMPNGIAILVDLGNAKAAADGARTLFFIRHQGTPGYAPPEQYPGGSGTDTRSDIYALGGTLYFALTGQEPPSVSTRNQCMQQGQPDLPSLQEVLSKNPREDEVNPAKQFRLGVSKPSKPAPRHSRHLAQLAILSPVALSQLNLVIQKAMAMRPRERYQSIADFANDLQKVVELMPTSPALSYNTQPGGPGQNPYKTQPDLPMVYDMIQQAKAVQTQQHDDELSTRLRTSNAQQVQSMITPSEPPTTPPVTQEACPHCGAPHKVGASFCPRCGRPLRHEQGISHTDVVHSSSSTRGAEPAPIILSTPVPQNQQNVMPLQTPVSSKTPAVTTVPDSTQQTFANNVSHWNTSPMASGNVTSHASPTQRQPAQNSSKPALSLNPGLILVIVLAVVLIILVIILIVLLMHHTYQIIMPQHVPHALISSFMI